jgi:hypothetical protein
MAAVREHDGRERGMEAAEADVGQEAPAKGRSGDIFRKKVVTLE